MWLWIGSLKLVIRKSNFVSICLLALASSIALTEYITYSPTALPDSIDEDLFSKDSEISENTDASESENESLDEQNETSQSTENSKNLSTAQINENKDNSKETVVSPNTDSEKEAVTETQEQKDLTPFASSNEHKAVINRGDTIASVLAGLGFDKTDVYLASKSLTKVFKLKNLKPGLELTIKGKKDNNGDLSLDGFEFKPDYKYRIVVTKTKSGFSAEKIEIPLKKVVRNISGVISPKSPDHSLKLCGVKPQIAKEALKTIGQVVNVRSSKSPVNFEFLYEDHYDEDGNTVGNPKLMYAAVSMNGKISRVYRFNDSGSNEYIDANGVILSTVAKSGSMLVQPIGYAKITSKFGIRRHPISGEIKGHTGVDFSASIGTPIRAAASGVVTKASHYSGYGRYISLSHGKNIQTAYGHLSRIAVRSGQHVKQGQIIGYTGNSGYSTGPHLHYEVIKNGRFINPMSFVKQEPQKLTGQKLRKFNQFKKDVNLQVVGLTPGSAKNSSGKLKKFS